MFIIIIIIIQATFSKCWLCEIEIGNQKLILVFLMDMTIKNEYADD